MNVATAPPPATTLTAFFHLCQSDNFAQTLLYVDVPVYFTWNSSSKSWIRRKRGEKVEVDGHEVFETPTIGRMYTVSPNQEECFFLRLLLTVQKGLTSFKSLRCFRGIEQATYREACIAHVYWSKTTRTKWHFKKHQSVIIHSPWGVFLQSFWFTHSQQIPRSFGMSLNFLCVKTSLIRVCQEIKRKILRLYTLRTWFYQWMVRLWRRLVCQKLTVMLLRDGE